MPFRLVSILASSALLLLAAVGIALAAKPQAGYTYTSTPSATSTSVSFTAVSAKKLTNFSAGEAFKCKTKTCGGFGGIKSLESKSVKVSKAGTFKVSGNVVEEPNKKIGTETVTGKFVSATEVTGKVTTHADLGEYEGVTESYKATGVASGT